MLFLGCLCKNPCVFWWTFLKNGRPQDKAQLVGTVFVVVSPPQDTDFRSQSWTQLVEHVWPVFLLEPNEALLFFFSRSNIKLVTLVDPFTHFCCSLCFLGRESNLQKCRNDCRQPKIRGQMMEMALFVTTLYGEENRLGGGWGVGGSTGFLLLFVFLFYSKAQFIVVVTKCISPLFVLLTCFDLLCIICKVCCIVWNVEKCFCNF